MNRPLRKSIMRYLDGNQERPFGEILRAARRDLGEISARSVIRYLNALVIDGLVQRSGVHGHHMYCTTGRADGHSSFHAYPVVTPHRV